MGVKRHAELARNLGHREDAQQDLLSLWAFAHHQRVGAAIGLEGGHDIAHHRMVHVVDVECLHFVDGHHDVRDAQILAVAAPLLGG